jgi:hypothetical protein
VCLLVGLLCIGGGVARAQTGLGILTGTVTDSATGRPIDNATVTATSPTLQGDQTVVTDAAGTYLLPQLPAGVYALCFDREGHRPYLREGIAVRAEQTLRLNVQLLPETISGETVLVTLAPPVVDVGSTRTGLVVTGDFAERIPIVQSAEGGVRDVTQLALAAPQTQRDLFGVSIDGTTSPENQYLLDGLSVGDTGYGASGTRFSVEFARELSVITGGYMPEYGRSSAGMLSVVSKSGGNEFHGSVFATYSPGALAQSGRVVQDNNSIFGSTTKLYNAGDVGFTLGGYLIQDRLWFFVGFNPSIERNSLVRSVSVFDLDSAGERISVPGGFQRTDVQAASRRYFQDAHVYPFFGKLTYLAGSDHRINLSFSGTPYSVDAPFARGVDGTYNTLGLFRSGTTYDVVGQLNSSFADKKLLLDVVLGWHHQTNHNHAIDDSWVGSGLSTVPYVLWKAPQGLANFSGVEPAYSPELASICTGPSGASRCQVAGYQTGGPDGLQEIRENRVQAKAILTALLEGLGHHILKGGADVDLSEFDKTPLFAGGAHYNTSGTPGEATFRSNQFGYLLGPDTPKIFFSGTYAAKTRSVTIGGFIQDSWSVLDRVILNLGVRLDSESISDGEGNVAMVLGNQWAPRVGLIWDPTYQGRAKIFASYGWYYQQMPLRLADFGLSRRSFLKATWSGCKDPSAVANGRCDQQSGSAPTPGGPGPSKTWTVQSFDELVDPSVLAPRTQEVVAGVEYAILGATRIGLTYTHRDLVHGMEDFSLDEGTTYWFGNPGHGVGASIIEATRIYNGYTVSLTRSFEDRWLAQASYTYSTLNGNLAGFYAPENTTAEVTQISPSVSPDFDVSAMRVNRFGPLAADARHQIKVHTAYQFVLSPTVGLTMGALYNARSGAPISAFGGYPNYDVDLNVVLIIPRGAVGRLPWVHELDLHATLDVRLGPDTTISFGADCFNVIGSQQVVAVDQSYVLPAGTAVNPIPNGTMADLPGKVTLLSNNQPLPASSVNTNFGRPTQYQPPRTVRFLARVKF